MTLPQEHYIFVREIADRPDDDGPRLIYADWLEEHGNPRGEFIRVQCDLERLDPLSADYHDLNVRNLELLGLHRKGWVNELLIPSRQRVFFRRGFVRQFKSTASNLLEKGDEAAELAPLTSLHLLGAAHDAHELANVTWLDHVHDLHIDAVSYDTQQAAPALRALLESNHLRRLRSLVLSLGRSTLDAKAYPLLTRFANSLQSLSIRTFPAETPQGLWDAPMTSLRRLEINSAFQTLHGLDAPNLSEVSLSRMETGPQARELKQLPWELVEDLRLSHCRQAALNVLRDRHAFENTRRLRLHNCHLPSFTNRLFRRTSLTGCKSLEVIRSNLEYEIDIDAFVKRLLKHPLATQLVKLQLPHLNSPRSQAVLAAPLPLEELHITQSTLPASPKLFRGIASTLRSLTISDSTIEQLSGVEFPRLQRLELRRCQYGAAADSDKAMAHLFATTDFPSLIELRIVQCNLGEATLGALGDKSNCPQLRVLDFAENEGTPAAINQVLESSGLPQLRRLRFPIYRDLKKYAGLIRAHGPRLQYTERNEAGFYGL